MFFGLTVLSCDVSSYPDANIGWRFANIRARPHSKFQYSRSMNETLFSELSAWMTQATQLNSEAGKAAAFPFGRSSDVIE